MSGLNNSYWSQGELVTIAQPKYLAGPKPIHMTQDHVLFLQVVLTYVLTRNPDIESTKYQLVSTELLTCGILFSFLRNKNETKNYVKFYFWIMLGHG